MANQTWIARITAVSLLLLSFASARMSVAQSAPVTHNLTFASANQNKDVQGRIVIVGLVTGDLPGVLTMAMQVSPSGVVTGGEWALSVSFTQFGPIDPDGDGDASEVLVQRGVIKGSIVTGVAGIGGSGQAKNINGLQLQVTGATVEFQGLTTGSGTFMGSGLGSNLAANGTLTLTF